MPTALTRQPAPSLCRCEVTHVESRPIDFALAQRQHRCYGQALQGQGVNVMTLPSDHSFPDSVFVEDNAIIFDEAAVLTSMGVVSRRGEPNLMKSVLSEYRPIVQVSPPAMIEGGDVIRLGKALFVGRSRRTNQAGIEILREIAKPWGYKVYPIEVNGCLHLKTACSPLNHDTFLVNPLWINIEALQRYHVLSVSEIEPFAANVLSVEHRVLASASHPRTNEMIEALGYDVTALNISEFMKAEGGVTCLSLIIG